MLLRAIIIAALCIATSVAEWSVCEHTNSIKKGSCNSASGPCEPGSGCTNAGKVDSLEACESKCEAAPNCSAIEWHSSAGDWTHVCVLQTAVDLTEQGYEVHVLVDGVVSRRQGDRQVALERMKQMGCWMSTSEMAMFQMIAEKEHPKFRDISGIAKATRSDGPWMAAI